MTTDVEIKPCTVCGVERGYLDSRTGIPFRNARGWCQSCKMRGGKPRIVLPCVDCNNPEGPKRRSGRDGLGSEYVVRTKGRCGNCAKKYYARIRKFRKAGVRVPNKRDRVVEFKPRFEMDLGALEEIRASWSPPKTEKVEVDPEHGLRVEIMRCIQDYRSAQKKWKAIKAYKLDAVEESESVLLSA